MTLTLDIPTGLDAPKRERLAMALYDARMVSQGQAAQIAGLSRAAFLEIIGQHGISPFQYDAEKILADAACISRQERYPMLQNQQSPLFRTTLALSIMLSLLLSACVGQAYARSRVHSSTRAHAPSRTQSPGRVRSSNQASLMASQVIHYVGGRKPYILLTPAAALPYDSQDKDKMPTSFDHFSLQTPKGIVSVYWNLDAVLEDGTMLVRTGPHPASSEAMEPQVTHIAFISPEALPIVLEVQQPWESGWLHVNGHRLSFFKTQSSPNNPGGKRIKLSGGFNLLQVGVNYGE